MIQSGAVFVWEESEDDAGLKRWTDGRVWSQSRMREVSQLPENRYKNLTAHMHHSRISSTTKSYLTMQAPESVQVLGEYRLWHCIVSA